jgi:hypothetical protein
MILTSTYRDQTIISRDLLAAFSSLDHSTTAGLSADALAGAFDRLLRRLTVLASLHGPDAPAAFLSALADPGDNDVVDLAGAFLEHGQAHITGNASEIQQELVHFSRIVDIGQLGLEAGVTEHALRRLRGSARIPDSLKVLSELVIVTRARLAQRGRLLPTPWLRPSAAEETDVDDDVTVAAPPATPDYWMAVRCDRRRIRRQCRYELSVLLEYLTPMEAALALWAHCHEQQLPIGIEFTIVQADPCGGVTTVAWGYEPGEQATEGDVIAHVARQLPTISSLTADQTALIGVGDGGYRIHATTRTSATVTELASGATTAALTAPPAQGQVTPQTLAEQARALLANYTGPDLASMEAGHIHLDRDLDIDQDTGATIGKALHDLLGERQAHPPVLTPMMDDDHVLVRLTPNAYRQFLHATFGDAPMHLICESSPIIRAIVVALYQRIRNSRLANRFQRRGGNLFLPLDDGSHCELFEDIDGNAPVTGCVFFEMALLIYRTAPARFDAYFTDRYQLKVPVHEQAATILSSCRPHDAKVTSLQDYYATFADVTDPHRPDPHVTALVNDVLTQAAPVTAHLNVLEDYYEVQQRRVRELLTLLGLPLRLVTVHFNAATGRVVCDA